MIQVTAQVRILVAEESADFRCGIDGLALLCRDQLREDPFQGAVFVFRNRARSALKLIHFDGHQDRPACVVESLQGPADGIVASMQGQLMCQPEGRRSKGTHRFMLTVEWLSFHQNRAQEQAEGLRVCLALLKVNGQLLGQVLAMDGREQA